MSFTYNEAIEALRNTPATQEALLDLVRQVSIYAEGKVTFLYPRSHSPEWECIRYTLTD